MTLFLVFPQGQNLNNLTKTKLGRLLLKRALSQTMNVNCTDNVIFSLRVRADVDYANIDSKTLFHCKYSYHKFRLPQPR